MDRTQFEMKRRIALRKDAEAQLANVPAAVSPIRSPEKLLHELQVHQLELEMQNEKLRRAYAALEESRDRFLDLYEFAPVGYLSLTREGLISEINLTGVALLGGIRKKLVNRRFANLVVPEDRDRWHRHFVYTLQHGETQNCELALTRIDGSILHARLDFLLYTSNSASSTVRVTITDITESKRVENELISMRHQLQATLDAIPDLLFELGPEGRIFDYHSPRTDFLATPPGAFIGKTLSDVFPPDVVKVCSLAMQEANEKGYSIGKQYALERAHGKLWFELSVSHKPVEFAQHPHFIFLARDITDRKQAEEQIHNMAFYDTLTRLPNRSLLNNRLDQAMAASKRTGRYGALMFLDLDDFKPINDKYGHDVGDLLLVEVANRISSCVRGMDTVARFGGDEFMVMLGELDTDMTESASQADIVAKKIRSVLAKPYELKIQMADNGEKTIAHKCTVSIGIKLFINHEAGAKDIVKCADIAMYQAKEAGRNQVRFYAP
jgi:diguanylate cyclase (GGDEF)-like protein/PAS domain S-box-containing protein